MRRLVVLILVLCSACTTLQEALGIKGGSTQRATLTTSDGASIILWRWAPTRANAPKVLVLPELGFDHRLVGQLCFQLRKAGFDVATVDGREITGAGGRFTGLAGWTIDVARAVAAQGPNPIVVAVGIGGDAALEMGRLGAIRGVVAINVPLRHAVGDEALRLALKADGYDPGLWLDHGIGALLLGAGKSTSGPDLDRLGRLASATSPEMNAQVVRLLQDGATAELPRIPIRALISVKDNLVATEDALPGAGGRLTHARRLGLIEGFRADYGHLDWLVDQASLDEVTPAIVEDLEAIP